jgi:hypothetical protein
MKEIATLRFIDADSKDEALAIIRASDKLIAIAFALQSDGDFEVFLETQDCRKLVAELQHAISISENS